MKQLIEIANKLYKAEINKVAISPIRNAFPGNKDVDAAYHIQQLVTQKKIDKGEKIIGKKIGLTSFAVQEQLGVNEPDFGILTDKMQIENHGKLDSKQLMQPKSETEWAFTLKSNLESKNIDIEEVEQAIDYAQVAIEIVGSRIKNWDIKITDTIADNASASHFVLGTEKIQLSEINLESCQMSMYKNDELVSVGTGKACMGNPLNAVLWLAKTMYSRQQPLQAGDIILSGALGPMVNLSQGDTIKAKINAFDSVDIAIL